MRSCETLLQDLQNRECDAALSALYAPDGNPEKLDAARDRAIRLMELFQTYVSPRQGAALFSGPGRTEIGGNHTDHQHGHVLCGSVDMDMMACAGPNEKDAIHIFSEGYPALVVDLNELAPVESERNTSAALVRGVAAKIREMGYDVKGFDAFVTSNVLSGSGLSSSAAYEALIGNIINHSVHNTEYGNNNICLIDVYKFTNIQSGLLQFSCIIFKYNLIIIFCIGVLPFFHQHL